MYRKILVPVDGSKTSRMGLNEALRLCTDKEAVIRLVHVVDELIVLGGGDGSFSDTSNMIPVLIGAGEQVLESAEAHVRSHDVKCESVLLQHVGGKAADMIVKEAGDWGADIIVMGTHGRRGMRRLVLGSDAEEIVRTARVPVLLVRSADDD